MPLKGFQPSFAAGVLGPSLHGRVDLAKYDVGLKVGKNIFIHTHGGYSNRAGFEFVGDVKDAAKTHRLVPFERDDEANYVLVFGDQNMQVVRNGAFVTSGPSRYEMATPYGSDDIGMLDYEQSVDVMFMAHRDFAPQRLEHTGATTWGISAVTFNPMNAAPTGVTVTPKAAGTNTYTYVVTAVDESGTESFQSVAGTTATAQLLSVAGAQNVITWTAAVGTVDHYRIYRERGGVFGYVGFANGLTFTDDNISANLEITPPVSTSLFSGVGDYPAKVALSQQRLFFAATDSAPESIWGSKVGDYENFTRSTVVRADDRYDASLSGPSINSVRGLLSLRDLIAFGARGEFTVSSENGISAISPQIDQYGYTGATDVRPLVVDDTALFVQRTGNVVRDLRYAFEQDGYTGNELTILAYHFFEGRQIVDWAYAQNPHSLIWVVLDDGSLLSLTYKREHQVWAWTEHEIDAEVTSVCVVTEDGYDAVYIIAGRDRADTGYFQSVLRLHERDVDDIEDAFFVDFGIKYSGSATTSISGLSHLEGDTVVALADGSVVEGLTVAGGTVTLPRAASKVSVGLPYVAEAETLPPPLNLTGQGTSRGRPINVSSVGLQVYETRGIQTGHDREALQEYIQSGPPDLSGVIQPVTGFIDINVPASWVVDGGTVIVRQTYPLPMTVLAAAPEIAIGY